MIPNFTCSGRHLQLGALLSCTASSMQGAVSRRRMASAQRHRGLHGLGEHRVPGGDEVGHGGPHRGVPAQCPQDALPEGLRPQTPCTIEISIRQWKGAKTSLRRAPQVSTLHNHTMHRVQSPCMITPSMAAYERVLILYAILAAFASTLVYCTLNNKASQHVCCAQHQA